MVEQPSGGSYIRGLVAKLLNDDELIINRGTHDGVVEGMTMYVVDPSTMDIKDPETGEDLGGVPRWKTVLTVTQVGDRVSLAERKKAQSPYSVANPFIDALAGEDRFRKVTEPQSWPEGVVVKDVVVGTLPKRK